MKETPYELLKDKKKKQLGKNNEAKMTLYNALSRKEYERVFMRKTAKEVRHTLIITHQGNSQVKNCKIDLLTQEYKNLKSLDPDYSSKSHVTKFHRALLLKWRAKVTTIEEAKDLAILSLDELISNLKEKSSLEKEHSKLVSKVSELELEVKKLISNKEAIEPCQKCVVLTQEVDSLKSNVSQLQNKTLNYSKFKKSSFVLDDMLSHQKLSQDKEEPKNIKEAIKDESWTMAMQEELDQFVCNDVWDLVPYPEGHTIIGTKWVFRNKLDENGVVSRNKAGLLAQGYNQQEGIDYDETYDPVARIESIRILLEYACS
nr:retrovirus-related Pol polyprotein from transposon TNT 1-94 [Tanacetum cinerariifolium]